MSALISLLLVMSLSNATAAFAVVYLVQASEDNYHYGVTGNVYVNTTVWVYKIKVTALWTTRTDGSAFCEIGHYWIQGQGPKAFYAYFRDNKYFTRDISFVSSGTYVSYKTFYDGNYKVYRFYKGSTLIASVRIPEMASCWPATNAERQMENLYCDNLDCFKDLRYKSSSTGSTWYNWNGVKTWYDNDPLFSNKFTSVNHVDVIRDVY